jgi:hypothetical protein
MVRLLKSMFAFVIVAAVLCMNTQASHAYQTGDSKWCAVMNKVGGTMQWECEYDTSDECATAVADTGGYCESAEPQSLGSARYGNKFSMGWCKS